ncbi:replication initiation protein [Hyphomicrobium sp. 2TAF46]|uniref:replication initiation protein n=1 Tax=Hyphomicrobium sp. 2TAF46 TaxID=3233019 RepID=UPI003F903501
MQTAQIPNLAQPDQAPKWPLSHEGASLRHFFADLLPARPYCSDNPSDGLLIRRRDIAIRKSHIQLNGPAFIQFLIFDDDDAGAALRHRDAVLPQPNAIAINKASHRAHSMVWLATPIAKHSAARPGPLAFAAAVERGMRRRLGADPAFTGLIAKNPLHSDWDVEWRRDKPYSLEELDSWLFERDKRAEISNVHGLGRNCDCFDTVRTIAYREVLDAKKAGKSIAEFQLRLEQAGRACNLGFSEPLPFSEIRAIAKSVAKWTWRNFSVERLSARQSILGRRGAAKRWSGHVSAEITQPWTTQEVSRATWYRRKKAAGNLNPSPLKS